MKKLRISALTSLVLAVVSFLWLIANFLALTDIWHGWEPNLDLEWSIVSYSFIPAVLFHLSVLVTLLFMFDFLRKQRAANQ